MPERLSIRHGRVFSGALIVFAAALAAVTAHVAIDVLGDYLLAHDTYDTVAHGSRGAVAAIVGMVGLALPLVLSWGALNDPHRGATVRRRIAAAIPAWPWFVLAVIALALPILVGMEMADAWDAAEGVIDLDDALGGSFLLGAGVTVVLGVACASFARAFARWIACVGDVLAAMSSAFRDRTRPRCTVSRALLRRRARRLGQVRSPLALREAKRGPPLPAR